jgi:hypothetical protein
VAAAAMVLAVAAGTAFLEVGTNPTGTASLDAATCAPGPTLAADTSTDTLLGVNATSPSQLSTDTGEFGHLQALRVYYTGMPDPNLWTSGVQGLNHSAVVVSFRSPPATVLSGADDAALAKFFDSAPTGHPIYYTYYHEPETLVQDGSFTTAQYRAAWTHVAAIADAAHNPDLKATDILMSWDLDPSSGINFKDYIPSGNVLSVLAWDAYPAGTVHNSNPQPTPPASFMGPAEAASRSVGLPYGFAEFALGTENDRPQWLASVAKYLQDTGALFGTLFDSTGFPWMYLTDSASINAWRAALAGSTPSQPPAPPPSSPPTGNPKPPVSPSPSGSPTSSASSSPGSTPTPGASRPATSPGISLVPSGDARPTPPTISQVRVDPKVIIPRRQNHVRIRFRLSQRADVAICVMGPRGTILRQVNQRDEPSGQASAAYFSQYPNRNLLPNGNYTLVIAASNAGGTARARAPMRIGSSASG